MDIRGEFPFCYNFSSAFNSSSFVAPILAHFARVRAFTIKHGCTYPEDARKWLNVLDAPAPELRDLTLSFDTFMSSCLEPDKFVYARAPKLRSLNLRGLQMQWNFTPPLLLRSIRLQYAYKAKYLPGPTFLQVLQCLQNLPLLEVCSIWRSLPASDGDITGIRVDLPQLRELTLVDIDQRCLALWASLNLPPACIIRVTLTGEVDDAKATLLSSCLRNHFMRKDCPTYRRVALVGGRENDEYVVAPDNSIHLALHTTPGRREDVSRYYTGPYKTEDAASTLRVSFPADHETELIRSLISLIPAEHVKTLWLSERMFAPRLDFSRLVRGPLHHFQAIRTLSISSMEDDEAHKLVYAFCAYLLRQCERKSTNAT